MALVTNVEVGPLYGVRHLVHSNTFVGHSLTKMVILRQRWSFLHKDGNSCDGHSCTNKEGHSCTKKEHHSFTNKNIFSSLFHFVMIIMVFLNPQGQQIVTSFQFYKLEQQAIIIFHFVLRSKSSRQCTRLYLTFGTHSTSLVTKRTLRY